MVGRVTPELGGDLFDGVHQAPVGPGLLIHLLRDLRLPGSEFGFLAAGAAAGAGRGQPVMGALGHQSVLELGDRAENLEEHTTHRGGGVDVLVEHDQVDTTLPQLGGQLDEVGEGTAEPVEFGDHQLVPGPVGDQQRLVEFGTGGEFAGGLVDEDLFATGRGEGVVVGVGFWSRLETRP